MDDFVTMLMLSAALKKRLGGVTEADLPVQTLRDTKGWSALHLAAVSGRAKGAAGLEEFRSALASSSPDMIEAKDLKGRTPLYLAVTRRWTDGALALLSHGANPRVTHGRKPNTTLVHECCSRSLPIVLEAVLAAIRQTVDPHPWGAIRYVNDTTSRGPVTGITPLHLIALPGKKSASLECLTILLSHGADVTARDSQGLSPIQLFTAYDNAAALLMIFKSRPTLSVNDPMFTGQKEDVTAAHADIAHVSLLRTAVARSAWEAFYALLGLGARLSALHATDGAGKLVPYWWHPIHELAKRNGPHQLAALLATLEPNLTPAERSAIVDVRKPDGWTALHLAARNGNYHCVCQLLKAGADPRLVTFSPVDAPVGSHFGARNPEDWNKTALDLAQAKGCNSIVRVLDNAIKEWNLRAATATPTVQVAV